MTKPYAEVIGDPISHSKSPLIHNFWLKKLGIDAEYRACHVRPEDLADYLAARRKDPDWRGCNVTIPHKERAFSLIDEPDAKAVFVGAVNTVFPLVDGNLAATNTDVDGVATALAGLEVSGRNVVVLGAGGAARAALAFLTDKRCGSIGILARNLEKAKKAARDCRLSAKIYRFEAKTGALEMAGLLVNATQLGMAGQDPIPDFIFEDLSSLDREALVFDMVYVPLETELLVAARMNGLRTVDGLTMLIGQAAVALTRFFDAVAPREYDDELRRLLTT